MTSSPSHRDPSQVRLGSLGDVELESRHHEPEAARDLLVHATEEAAREELARAMCAATPELRDRLRRIAKAMDELDD